MKMYLAEAFDFLLLHGLNFSVYLVLSFLFVDVLRQINKRLIVKLCFLSLTFGSISICWYSLSNQLPLYVLFLGLGLFPLTMGRMRYAS